VLWSVVSIMRFAFMLTMHSTAQLWKQDYAVIKFVSLLEVCTPNCYKALQSASVMWGSVRFRLLMHDIRGSAWGGKACPPLHLIICHLVASSIHKFTWSPVCTATLRSVSGSDWGAGPTCVEMWKRRINWKQMTVLQLLLLLLLLSAAAAAIYFLGCDLNPQPPLWSRGQSSWLQIQRSRVRFLALPDFLRSSGSGTGSTQPREDNWGATWMKMWRLLSRNPRLTTVGISCADHATPPIRKVGTNFADKRRPLRRYSSLAD
jgi:hypothetical protein